ncbi:hypothetical protein [Bosea vestrisii]|uniref:IclR-like helix-turn-helix domain-containing protein n=1 Tax=Bosea vestrisii TaxID=151416 RepID=A0ABW0HAT0_9HYPH
MAGNATHQAAVLGAIGRGLLTLDQLDDHLPMTRRSAVEAVRKLIGRGLIERQERGRYTLAAAGCATLEAGTPLSSGQRGPRARPIVRPSTLRQRCWNAMRIRKRFTVADIAMLAADGNANPEISAQQYLRGLARSGYVIQLPTRRPGNALTSNGWIVWQLERDSGDTAPIVRRSCRDVYDPNTGEAHPWR